MAVEKRRTFTTFLTVPALLAVAALMGCDNLDVSPAPEPAAHIETWMEPDQATFHGRYVVRKGVGECRDMPCR